MFSRVRCVITGLSAKRWNPEQGYPQQWWLSHPTSSQCLHSCAYPILHAARTPPYKEMWKCHHLNGTTQLPPTVTVQDPGPSLVKFNFQKKTKAKKWTLGLLCKTSQFYDFDNESKWIWSASLFFCFRAFLQFLQNQLCNLKAGGVSL